jgi:hypothetical protein
MKKHVIASRPMARKQVLVQLDDDLVAALDEAAAALGISRSLVIREAARQWLADEDMRQAEREWAESYRRIPPGAEWNDDYASLYPGDRDEGASGAQG